MQLPSVVHPKQITLDGYTFEVVAHFPLTDAQALKIAIHHLRQTPRQKLCKKGVHQILFVHDAHFLALL